MKPTTASASKEGGERIKMRSLPIFIGILLLSLFSLTSSLQAQVNLVVNTPLCFTDMDNNPLFDEDAVAGQVTVHSVLMLANGSISHNDPGSDCPAVGILPNDPAGAIKIIVLNDFEMQNGSSIYTENRIQSGRSGDITLSVGGAYLMKIGSLISSSNLTATSGDRSAGNIKINVIGNIVMDAGSEIRANSAHGNGGDIEMTSNENITINGFVFSKDESNQSGSGNNQAHGGFIFIQANKTLFIGDPGIVSSRGFDAGADLVHLCACDITIFGLVESTATGHGIPSDPPNHLNHTFRPDKDPNSTAGVEIWASSSLLIDNVNHNGEVNADLCCGGGTNGESYIDIFCKSGNITIIGKIEPDNLSVQNTNFAVHANGAAGNSDNGGTITIKALNGKVIASGLAVQADGTILGGSIAVEAKLDVDLTDGTMTARGRTGGNTTNGGRIDVRSYSGKIGASAASKLETVGTVSDGQVNLTACTTVEFPPGVSNPVATINAGVLCTGSPSLATQPYVEFCGVGDLTITKVFLNDDPGHNPAQPWTFTISPAIGGVSTYTIPVFNDLVPHSITIPNVPNGVYTITETEQLDPFCSTPLPYATTNTCGTGRVATVTLADCIGASCLFTNTPQPCQPNNECQWCNKGAVLSQVWQNPGGGDPNNKCEVPDILVDVRMPHNADNDVVTPNEIGTGIPATWSIQAAVDYANAHINDPAIVTNEIFIGVTATDPVPAVPGDPNACGRTCVRPYAGDNPFGVENVIVRNLNTQRMNIFGCSVTMKPLNAALPVFTVQDGVGKVTILDLHVKNSSTGYLVKGGANGNADLVVIKNSAAWNNDIGYNVQDDNVEITGAQHIYGNRIGILVAGTNIKLRTNSDIIFNTEAGIKITGNGNETNGNEVGNSGHPNAVGIWVTGNNNNLHDDNVSYNTGNGIFITGSGNTVHQEDANSNGQNGISAELANGATGNKLDGNKANKNVKQGIRACGQIDLGGNQGTDNGVEPQVAFTCPDPSTAVFSVVDMTTDKAYKYNASFALVSSTALNAANSDGNDEVAAGTNTYVLDKVDKQVYRYLGTAATSKILKSSTGTALNTPSGMAIDGDQLWVVDGGTKIIYRYSLAAAFANTIATTVNAVQQIPLTGNNGNAEGLALDATYLYVLDNSDKQFYRYPRAGGVQWVSRIMKDAGSSLGNPSGAVLVGTDMWIVDNGKDKAYKYSMANLAFALTNTLSVNESAKFPLFSLNANATGIAAGTSTNLLRSAPVKQTVPISEVKDMPIEVYPNPSHDKVLVQFSNATVVKYTLQVVDMAGRPVMTYSDVTTEGITVHEFNVSKLAKGSYLIMLEKKNMKKELKKIIVQ